MDATKGRPRHRVRVWFGPHAIADYAADADLAERYAVAMDRRFPGLRITNEPVDSAGEGESESTVSDPAGDALLWPQTSP